MCLYVISCVYRERRIFMNASNITNYKPKDFAELLGVSVKKEDKKIAKELQDRN